MPSFLEHCWAVNYKLRTGRSPSITSYGLKIHKMKYPITLLTCLKMTAILFFIIPVSVILMTLHGNTKRQIKMVSSVLQIRKFSLSKISMAFLGSYKSKVILHLKQRHIEQVPCQQNLSIIYWNHQLEKLEVHKLPLNHHAVIKNNLLHSKHFSRKEPFPTQQFWICT